MNKSDIQAGRIYTDGNTAIREVLQISDTAGQRGSNVQPMVIYRELAGHNRGKEPSLTLDVFAAWARRELLTAAEQTEQEQTLGLHAFPLSAAERALLEKHLLIKGHQPRFAIEDETHRAHLERITARGFARRETPSRQTAAYILDPRLLTAADFEGSNIFAFPSRAA